MSSARTRPFVHRRGAINDSSRRSTDRTERPPSLAGGGASADDPAGDGVDPGPADHDLGDGGRHEPGSGARVRHVRSTARRRGITANPRWPAGSCTTCRVVARTVWWAPAEQAAREGAVGEDEPPEGVGADEPLAAVDRAAGRSSGLPPGLPRGSSGSGHETRRTDRPARRITPGRYQSGLLDWIRGGPSEMPYARQRLGRARPLPVRMVVPCTFPRISPPTPTRSTNCWPNHAAADLVTGVVDHAC
jgi:hypothetical protein